MAVTTEVLRIVDIQPGVLEAQVEQSGVGSDSRLVTKMACAAIGIASIVLELDPPVVVAVTLATILAENPPPVSDCLRAVKNGDLEIFGKRLGDYASRTLVSCVRGQGIRWLTRVPVDNLK